MSNLTFGLMYFQVPEPPTNKNEADELRWLVMVMDPTDPELSFVAGVLGFVLARGGITSKQWGRLQFCFDRVVRAYGIEALRCQSGSPDVRSVTGAVSDGGRQ